MHAELYSDGVSEITVSGTIVRVDLFSLSPTERDENNVPRRVFRQRLIFSLDGFANSVEVMQRALNDLIRAGAVTTTQRKNATDASVGPYLAARGFRPVDTGQMADRSPNFPQPPTGC